MADAAQRTGVTDRDELAVFDDDLVEAVAADHGVAPDRLATLARTHQTNVRALPGVDDIVYEWRNHFHQDPMLARTRAAYYLALPDHVWDEFVDDIGATDAERGALLALHDEQTRRDAPDVGLDTGRLDRDRAVVLSRP